jgi:hypothetical protein
MRSIITFALEVIRLPADPADLSAVACPGCHESMEVLQPEPGRPGRLLGTCPSCSAWYLIDAVGAVMCRLPDADALRDAGAAARRLAGPPGSIP